MSLCVCVFSSTPFHRLFPFICPLFLHTHIPFLIPLILDSPAVDFSLSTDEEQRLKEIGCRIRNVDRIKRTVSERKGLQGLETPCRFTCVARIRWLSLLMLKVASIRQEGIVWQEGLVQESSVCAFVSAFSSLYFCIFVCVMCADGSIKDTRSMSSRKFRPSFPLLPHVLLCDTSRCWFLDASPSCPSESWSLPFFLLPFHLSGKLVIHKHKQTRDTPIHSHGSAWYWFFCQLPFSTFVIQVLLTDW